MAWSLLRIGCEGKATVIDGATTASGGSLERLREANRLRVVEALRLRGSASRSDLVELTGLSRTTITTLIADLQARGLIATTAPTGHCTRAGARPWCCGWRRPPARRWASPSATATSTSRGRSRLDRARRAPPRNRRRPLGVRRTRRRRRADRRGALGGGGRQEQVVAAGMGIPGPIAVTPGAWAHRRSCRAGRACTRPRRSPAGSATSTSKRSTTPTSARWPNPRWARGRGSTTSSTSRSRAASAPASCSAGACITASPGIAGRDRSRPGRARTAPSAAAATAAAWRRSPRCRRCSRPCRPAHGDRLDLAGVLSLARRG